MAGLSPSDSTSKTVVNEAADQAPELGYPTDPQVYRRAHEKQLSLPITVHSSIDVEHGLQTDGSYSESSHSGLEKEVVDRRLLPRLRKRWIALACILAVLLAISVGVGVGVTRRNEASSVPALPGSSSPDAIMDDTSLASVTTPDGNRYLFFQDNSGAIRRATYVQEGGHWIAHSDPSTVMTREAKPRTPISAQALTNRWQGKNSTSVYVHFLDTSNRLNVVSFSGPIPDPKPFTYLDALGNYTCDPDARSLVVAYRVINSTTIESWIALELPDDEVALVHGVGFDVGAMNDDGDGILLSGDITIPETLSWSYLDMTFVFDRVDPNLSDEPEVQDNLETFLDVTFRPNNEPLVFTAPFTGGIQGTDGDATDIIDIAFFNPTGSYNTGGGLSCFTTMNENGSTVLDTFSLSFISDSTLVEGSREADDDQTTDLAYDQTAIQASDFVWPSVAGEIKDILDTDPDYQTRFAGLWVNDTSLSFFQPLSELPLSVAMSRVRSEFPFRRLATISPERDGFFHLYHQINHTTFAEDTYYYTLKEWDVQYFSVELEAS